MSDCGCHHEAKNAQERRVLWIALALNAAMAVIGGIAGWIAHSTGLLADALDMLSDATAYAIGLVAIGRTARFKANAAWVSGSVLLVLGVGVLVEVGRRVMYGAEPVSGWMIGTALLSLAVNMAVLRMLAPLKSGEVEVRRSASASDVAVHAGRCGRQCWGDPGRSVGVVAGQPVPGFRDRRPDRPVCDQGSLRDFR